MKSDLFKVVFTGQLDGTLSVNIIRNKLAKLLNQNHKKVESFLSVAAPKFPWKDKSEYGNTAAK